MATKPKPAPAKLVAAPKQNNPKNVTPTVHGNFLRTMAAGFLGFAAIGLILSAIFGVWLDRTLTDTDTYVKTVGPLVEKPEVRNYIVESITDSVLSSPDVPVREVAGMLLPADQIAGKSDEQLRSDVKPAAKQAIDSLIATPEFAEYWKTQNEDLHRQFVAQLNDDQGEMTLDFQPLLTQGLQQLDKTQLAPYKSMIQIPADAGKVTIPDAQLAGVRKSYKGFKNGVIATVIAAIVCSVLCVIVSVDHMKTIRRILVITAIFCGVGAALLSTAALLKIGGMPDIQRQLMVTIFDSLTHNLRISLIVIAVVCVVGAVASKLYSVVSARKGAAV